MSISKSLTLNQVIDIFSDFASRHLQINSFYCGTVDKIGDSDEFIYPLLAAIPGEVIISSNQITDLQRMSEFRFTILACDLEKSDDTNEVEIRSDMIQILSDFIAECDGHDFFYDNNLEITGDLVMTPFTERFSDIVTGYALNFNIRAPFKFLVCSAPIVNKTNSTITGDC